MSGYFHKTKGYSGKEPHNFTGNENYFAKSRKQGWLMINHPSRIGPAYRIAAMNSLSRWFE